MQDQQLRIGGFTPLTTIDFPGRLAAVVFCQGCPWRCRYCQNSHLIPHAAKEPVEWKDVVDLLERRRGLLDGVVFSGGEPTLQQGLPDAVRTVSDLGYEVGLHTAGPYPERLAAVLPLVDWVGFDIKAPATAYPALTSVPGSGEKAMESAGLILESGVEYEFRTTVHPDLLGTGDLVALGRNLADMGVQHYVLQGCVTGRCLDTALCAPAGPGRLEGPVVEALAHLFSRFEVRGA